MLHVENTLLSVPNSSVDLPPAEKYNTHPNSYLCDLNLVCSTQPPPSSPLPPVKYICIVSFDPLQLVVFQPSRAAWLFHACIANPLIYPLSLFPSSGNEDLTPLTYLMFSPLMRSKRHPSLPASSPALTEAVGLHVLG